MDTQGQIRVVKEIVKDYLDENEQFNGLHPLSLLDKSHIISIGTSILCTKWDIGYGIGGSFVQSVVDNDLREAIGRADETNLKALKFYCQLMYNVGKPIFDYIE